MKKIVIIILFFSLSIISAVENLHMAFTGNMRGLLLPCNCSIPTGGLARRREYFHNQSDNHLLVDAGNIFFSAAPKTQTEMTNMMIISDYIACYYSDYLCYDVINVGEYDCLLGMDILLRYINNYE